MYIPESTLIKALSFAAGVGACWALIVMFGLESAVLVGAGVVAAVSVGKKKEEG